MRATLMPRAAGGPGRRTLRVSLANTVPTRPDGELNAQQKRARLGQNAPRWIGRDVREYESAMVATLSIIGAGRVGQTLGRLWVDRGRVRVLQIMNRSLASGAAAAAFIGQGTPIEDFGAIEASDLVLLATSDRALGDCAHELAASGVLAPGSIVFHSSGAVGLEVLAPAARAGARVARLHALRSFASPARAVPSFPGTHCGLEGDAEAVAVLETLLHACGGQTFRLPSAGAVFYHAAAVMVSNYLVALIDAGLRSSAHAGFASNQASAMLRGLVTSTLDNVFEVGTSAALTGPIARGDAEVVRTQLDALRATDPELAEVYRALGTLALDLSRRQGSAPPASLVQIDELLRGPSNPSDANR